MTCSSHSNTTDRAAALGVGPRGVAADPGSDPGRHRPHAAAGRSGNEEVDRADGPSILKGVVQRRASHDSSRAQPLVAAAAGTTGEDAGDVDAGYDDFDADSALGDDGQSSTMTVAEEIFNYQYENGRRYHAYRAGAYPMPNDEREQDRMDMQHHIYLLLFGGELYRAPLPQHVYRVLDIGCGTGIWAIDFADMHAEASVVATDLSVIQPQWVPPNLQFEIDDAEAQWQYRSKFDYIHVRSMGGSIQDWPRLLRQAYDNLAPGGWVELMDFEAWATTDDGSLPESSAYHEFQTRLSDAAQAFGKVMNTAPKYKDFVVDAGFEGVVHESIKVPLSPWPQDPKSRKLGRLMNIQMMESIEPYSMALFTRVLRWDNARIQALLAGVRQDLRNMDYHIYTVVHCVYGQKPF